MIDEYLVSAGDYADYTVIGVFDDKEMAEECVVAYNREQNHEHAEIETCILNLHSKKGGYLFLCRINEEEGVIECRKTTHNWGHNVFEQDVMGKHMIHVIARDMEHARKIAADKFRVYIAGV